MDLPQSKEEGIVYHKLMWDTIAELFDTEEELPRSLDNIKRNVINHVFGFGTVYPRNDCFACEITGRCHNCFLRNEICKAWNSVYTKLYAAVAHGSLNRTACKEMALQIRDGIK